MDKKGLLKEYNRLNRERLQLLEDNLRLFQSYDAIVNSKAGLILRGFRKAEDVFLIKPMRSLKKSFGRTRECEKPSYAAGAYEGNETYDLTTDIKALAFYLPQFHTFPENDEWWGKGFMEWTNTRKAQPRFIGHYQPREPHDDFGYYELTNKEILKKQINLAKEHHVYGFCFYYYWFSGKKLMEKPIDILLKNKDLDFPFCLCWANENWTRRWDGLNNEVLIEQKYEKRDPEIFIKDMKKYLVDKRYIRVDDKPVILVYNPKEIPNFEETVASWRRTAREIGIGEIEIWSYRSLFDDDFSNCDFVDAEFDFAPKTFPVEILDSNHGGNVVDYGKLVDFVRDKYIYENHHSLKPFYYSVTMDWDNSPRRADGFFSFANYSPESFYKWTRRVIKNTRMDNPADTRFMFVNAWNEWAEGTYLEPDKKYGYLNINTFTKALLDIPFDKSVLALTNGSEKADERKRIALQIHVFYIDVFDEILSEIKRFPFKLDLYISTDSNEKSAEITKLLKNHKIKTGEVVVEVVENRGRDIYPFLKQLSGVYKNYDYVGHIHTKKSVENVFGDNWRKYLFNALLGTDNNARRVLGLFKNEKAGIVFPANYESVLHQINIGSNKKELNRLLKKMGLKKVTDHEEILFPAGAMFWARAEAIGKIFDLGLTEKDFPEEAGQTDGTIAHAIERLFGIVPSRLGYDVVQYIDLAKD